MKNHAMLTVFGKDRPGIIAAVTEVLFQQGCNLEDVSMTVLEGELVMMTVVGFDKRRQKKILEVLQRVLEKKMRFNFSWRELSGAIHRGEKHTKNSESYIITCAGKDRTGIVYRVSRLMAKCGLNISDLNCKILGYGPNAVYTMLLEVDVPRAFSLSKLERSLKVLAKSLKISIDLKPLERIEL
ncbi:MAG: ACT domain-containing protein [Candidatus Omnitrophica bacterium]|nr:ACT domain-containing protein [Candidatus Omnitrophota bacterium]